MKCDVERSKLHIQSFKQAKLKQAKLMTHMKVIARAFFLSAGIYEVYAVYLFV